MLTPAHLVLGLNALSRAHTGDYFADGHRGAAMIAAYFLCRREEIEPGATRVIARLVDQIWSTSPLFAPFPEEAPDPTGVTQIAGTLAASTDRLRQAGHNVILPSLALKAMAVVPEAVTPSRVAGICKLVEAFAASDDEVSDEPVTIPAPSTPSALAEYVLSEALATMERFRGRGQGWSGHLLTHGQAVLDLQRCGHAEAAGRAAEGLVLYVRRVRQGPGDADREIAEHPPSDLTPLRQSYWEGRPADTVGLGHCFKYPYAFYGLLDLVSSPQLKARCLQQAFRIF